MFVFDVIGPVARAYEMDTHLTSEVKYVSDKCFCYLYAAFA